MQPHRTALDMPRASASYWPGVIAVPENLPSSGEDGANGGVLFVILFWFSLAASLELWWLDTPGRRDQPRPWTGALRPRQEHRSDAHPDQAGRWAEERHLHRRGRGGPAL
jgi:hypothetical protein